jgi:hypothetical protein
MLVAAAAAAVEVVVAEVSQLSLGVLLRDWEHTVGLNFWVARSRRVIRDEGSATPRMRRLATVMTARFISTRRFGITKSILTRCAPRC